MPKSLKGWAMFTLAVLIAGAVISTVARRVPIVAQIAQGV